MVKVSRCMSTQHPDNINTPFFSDSEVLAGEAEIKEAFYVFSQLGCREQMWDSEGKEVDDEVIEKLISKYTEFFKKNIIGKDVFLTYRVPNPSVQKEQGKVLLETLHSIPRAFDVAQVLGQNVAPIFEVILPMTTSSQELEMIRNYYERVIIGQKNAKVSPSKTVREWVGDFQPEHIDVIPLFESYEAFANSSNIIEQYLSGKRQEYQRVFYARSDPALNYGSVSAVLMAKMALFDMQEVQEKLSIDIFPILGVGSAPFRGNFRPDNVSNCGEEYPSVQTFTIQSSFKYDHPFRDVANAIDMLNTSRRGQAPHIEKKSATKYIHKIKDEYQKQIVSVADIINTVSAYIPSRRSRKLHVGLFGYSRSLKGITLPRAIKFCGAFYSLGVPAELLGLNALTEKEFEGLHEFYLRFDDDLKDICKYVNVRNIKKMPKNVSNGLLKVLEWVDYEEDPEYVGITSRIYDSTIKGDSSMLVEDIKSAAWMRKFLG
ncbi:MAG: phosphoenolpyruvate carboxylase [Candidatus Micrarchaeota archaeon]